MQMDEILKIIDDERKRQYQKYGEESLKLAEWLLIMQKKLNEVISTYFDDVESCTYKIMQLVSVGLACLEDSENIKRKKTAYEEL